MNTQLITIECPRIRFKGVFSGSIDTGLSPSLTVKIRYLIRCSQHSRRHTAGSPRWDGHPGINMDQGFLVEKSSGNHGFSPSKSSNIWVGLWIPNQSNELVNVDCFWPAEAFLDVCSMKAMSIGFHWHMSLWLWRCSHEPRLGEKRRRAEVGVTEGRRVLSCGQWTCPKTGDPTMSHHVPPCSTTKMYRPG